MVTVVDTNDIVWTIYQSWFTATTTNVIQIDATSSSTKVGIGIGTGTCKNKIVDMIDVAMPNKLSFLLSTHYEACNTIHAYTGW